MKRFLALILSALMVLSTVAICAVADEPIKTVTANVNADHIIISNTAKLVDGDKALEAAGWGNGTDGVQLIQNKVCTDAMIYPVVELVLDLGESVLVDKINAAFYHDYNSMIGLPDDNLVNLAYSDDGENYTELGAYETTGVVALGNHGVEDNSWDVKDGYARYIRYSYKIGYSGFTDKCMWEFTAITELGVTEGTAGCSLAVAGTEEFTANNDEITLTLTLKNITLEKGLSYITFRVYFNSEHVQLKDSKETIEADGFNTFLKTAPSDWATQLVKVEEDYIECTFSSNRPGYAAKNDGAVVIVIPFVVFNAATEELIFEVPNEYIECGDDALELEQVPGVANDVKAKNKSYGIQPSPLEAVPEGMISFNYAGYIHAANESVVIAGDNQTIGEITKRGMGEDFAENDMNYWEILVVDGEGKIIEINTTLGRPAGLKTDTVCPEGGFIIGYHGAGHVKAFEVGGTVRLVNVKLDTLKIFVGYQKLINAGFVYTAPVVEEIEIIDETVLTKNADGTVKLLAAGKSASQVLAAFKGDVRIVDKNGETLASNALVGTGCVVSLGDLQVTVVLTGDITGDGKRDAKDYLLIKRKVLGFEAGKPLSGVFVTACDINGDGNIKAADYVLLKRAVLNLYTIN